MHKNISAVQAKVKLLFSEINFYSLYIEREREIDSHKLLTIRNETRGLKLFQFV